MFDRHLPIVTAGIGFAVFLYGLWFLFERENDVIPTVSEVKAIAEATSSSAAALKKSPEEVKAEIRKLIDERDALVIPGLVIENEDHGSYPVLNFDVDGNCSYPVDGQMLVDLMQPYFEKGYSIVSSEDEPNRDVSMSSIGEWVMCGESVTLEGPRFMDNFDAPQPNIGGLGWPLLKSIDQTLQIERQEGGRYLLNLARMESGGPNGTQDVFMRYATGTDSYVEFLAHYQGSMRYNGGMYDDNYGCPCTDIQRFFVSERYPLKNLLPLVELQYRIDELYKRLDE